MKKRQTIGTIVITTAVAFALLLSPATHAQEHPEHPEHSEHSEHPSKDETATVTVEQMAQAITDFIYSDVTLKGGFFFVYDASAEEVLRLTLDKVHTERLSQVGDNLFFACSDFNSTSGKVYDLDFFMESRDGKLEVTELMIHKENGEPRYSWFEEDGVWKRK